MDRVYTRLPTSSIILNVSYFETSIRRWHVDLVHHTITRKFVITSTLEQSMGSTFPGIVPAYRSHNAPEKYPAMYDIVIEICTCSLISVAKGCIVRYRTVALWYVHNRLIGNYKAWQYDHPNFKSPGKIYIFYILFHLTPVLHCHSNDMDIFWNWLININHDSIFAYYFRSFSYAVFCLDYRIYMISTRPMASLT